MAFDFLSFLFDTTFMLCQFGCVVPDFISAGLLPSGIHWSDLAEIRAKYCWNIHRERLFGGFERAVVALRVAGCRQVYLNGSFATTKEYPGDYDACWEMAGVDLSLLDPVFLDFKNLRAAQKAKYLGEFFPASAHPGANAAFQTFLTFFQVDKSSGSSKGIIGIKM
ncbi:MAG TPA: hypothetical protein VNV43_05355 [Candidatus Acidoferrales bacterium]|jgi:hypothetical protein|nr:hypothetical protein [Candidatus Acidoferrales bacterium]